MSELIQAKALKDKNGVGIEFVPAAHKHEKNDVTGLATDLITLSTAVSELEEAQEGLKEATVTEVLNELAGADTTDSAVAALTGEVRTLKVKVSNMAEDMATLQGEVDELELAFVEYFSKMAFRLIHVERQLGIRDFGADVGYDFSLPLDDSYDEMFGQS